MQNKQINWCFGIKDGLRLIEPNERLAKLYIQEAKTSLKTAENNLKNGDLLWTTVVVYYAEYYALYSFLQKIGIKCENHACSILATSYILGNDKTEIINLHKEKRIDAQYYMKIDKKDEVSNMLQKAKTFVLMFDEIVSNLNEKEINLYKERIQKVKDTP